MKLKLKELLAKIVQALPQLIAKTNLIESRTDRPAVIRITSHDSVCTLEIIPPAITSATPAVNMDFRSDGYITIYTDTGSGWVYRRTL